MQISIIRSPQQLENLADEWNALLKESASHVPFLRFEYVNSWWRFLGGGEWRDGELYIVCGRDDNNRLIGIAPLFLTKNKQGKNALMFIGSMEICDYLDIISRPKDLQGFVEALFDFLESDEAPPWQVLDFYNIFEESPTLNVLEQVAIGKNWKFTHERLQGCPVVSLPDDWDTYLAGIDKKQRHEIRRKIRRAEESDIPIRWYIVQDETNLDSEIDEFFRLMSQDTQKQAFLTETMRDQMRAIIKATFEKGWLQLAFLEVGDQKAATYLNFDYDNSIWVYNSGLDYSFGTYSPGWVLLGYLLQWAIQQGKQSFDFMRGDEDYKYRFGGVNRFVMRAMIERN